MTTFQLQTSLTTQICELSGEKRVNVVFEAYKKTRALHPAGFAIADTIPVLNAILAEEIDLFVVENIDFNR